MKSHFLYEFYLSKLSCFHCALIIGILSFTTVGTSGSEAGTLNLYSTRDLHSSQSGQPAGDRVSAARRDARDHLFDARWTVQTIAKNESEGESTSPGEREEGEEIEEPKFDTFWAWLWDYLYNGASITLGVGTRQAELGVTRKSDDDYGKIVQRNEEAYFISYSTRTTFMGTTRLAYTFMLNYSTFNLDKQEIGKDDFVALGTQVKGDMAYVVPAVFYQWGEDRYSGTYARIGIGVGLGVTRYRGDIKLFPSGDIVSLSDGTYDLNFAYGAFAEARFRHIGIKISAAGPTFEDDLYKYNVSDIAISLGYQFYFP